MTRDEAHAAVTLFDGASDTHLDEIQAECAKGQDQLNGYKRRDFTLAVELSDGDDGAKVIATVTVDTFTGMHIIEAARKIIAARRKELGMDGD